MHFCKQDKRARDGRDEIGGIIRVGTYVLKRLNGEKPRVFGPSYFNTSLPAGIILFLFLVPLRILESKRR